MGDDWEADIRMLLRQSRICFLATTGKEGPESSMAPYAIFGSSILLHLSTLASHAGNIEKSPACGLMICAAETSAGSPLALPRLALQGRAEPVADTQYETARVAYLQAIPDAEPLFSFGDFRLFEFKPAHIRWVGGFGKAHNIPLEIWGKVSHINIS